MNLWEFKASTDPETVDLLVYGYLVAGPAWEGETGARDFAQALAAHAKAKRINVRINSGGGDLFAGVAIHSMLQSHPAEIIATVEGLAGSAASLIAMAGDRTIMHPGSMLMIHNPSALAMGDASELRQTADVLDKVRAGLVSIYQAKTGRPADELSAMLDAETWLTAEEAVEQGFADEVAGPAVKVRNRGQVVFLNAVGFAASAVPEGLRARRPMPAPALAPEARALTREILAAEAPILLASVLEEGAAGERARQKAIDAIAVSGHEVLVSRARYEAPITAEALALQILQAERGRRERYMSAARADAEGAAVPPSPVPAPTSNEADRRAIGEIVAGGNERRARR